MLAGRRHEMIEETTVLAKTPPRTLVAHARVEAEPRMMSDTWRGASSTWPTLPLEANVQFMTVMVTKMPYIGPG